MTKKSIRKKNVFLGLKPLRKDQRKKLFKYSSLCGATFYTPKYDEFDLPETRILNQSPNNTCTFYAGVGGKEIDEKVNLSPKSVVKIAKKLGYISKNGFSSLESVQKVMKNYGVAEESVVPDTSKENWDEYSKYDLTPEQLANMAKHKTQTYWLVQNYLEAIKLLEEGRYLTFGIPWMSGCDNPQAPDYILKFTGVNYGGHSLYLKGHKFIAKRFKGKNSFGEKWGNKGCFEITFDDFNKFAYKYGVFVNLDIPRTVADFLIANNGKVIKENNGSRCYFIENGTKRLFDDEFCLWAYNFRITDIETDEEDMLPQVKDGDKFLFEYGQRAHDLKEILRGMESGRLQELGKKYFPEFFNK